jgi:hypothetical protein
LVIIAWSRVSGGISATALITIATSGGVGIGSRMHVSSRHDGLRGARIGDWRWRVRSLARSVGRVSGSVGRRVVVGSILGSTVRTLGIGVHVWLLCRSGTECGRGWSRLLANLMNGRCGIVRRVIVRGGVRWVDILNVTTSRIA